MRIIMRIFFLMCILGASLTIAAQNIIYGNKNEQRAINMAFDILQVYYHSKELCVSDSIYDLDWDIFSDMVDTQTKQILWSYRIEKNLFGTLQHILKLYYLYSVLKLVILVCI